MVNINQPSNQIKLTNVSIVRMKKGKKRYELACYKNKVLEYRTGTETDLDEVLQIHQIFTNVSKGAVAPSADLSKSFPGLSTSQIILEILSKGELQVGEKERGAQLESLHNEVIGIVAGKCVDPKTKRVYTTGMIEKALGELRENPKFGGGGSAGAASEGGAGAEGAGAGASNSIPTWHGVTLSRPSKVQALDAIKALIHHQPISIARARMKLLVLIPPPSHKKCKDKVLSLVEKVESENFLGEKEGWECVGFVEPGKYKVISDLVSGETKGKGRVEVLEMADVHEGDETG